MKQFIRMIIIIPFLIFAILFGTVETSMYLTNSIDSLTSGIVIIEPMIEVPIMLYIFLTVLMFQWIYDIILESIMDKYHIETNLDSNSEK